MFNFLKKHPCCIGFLTLSFSLYAYFYLTYFRYEPDRYDKRHYPLPPLTEKWSKTIEYKSLPYVKFDKCFLLSFDSKKLEENLANRFGEHYYRDVYRRKYTLHHIDEITEEEFYQEAKEKPHFWMKVYKNNALLETRELYFAQIKEYEVIKMDNKEVPALQIFARRGYKPGGCYSFEANSQYRLELMSDTIAPEFQDVGVFLQLNRYTTNKPIHHKTF